MPNGNNKPNKRNRHSGPKPRLLDALGHPVRPSEPPVDNGTIELDGGKQLTTLGLVRLLVRFIESAGGAITIAAKDIEKMPTTHIRFKHHKELDIFDIGVHREGQANPLDTPPPRVIDETEDQEGDPK